MTAIPKTSEQITPEEYLAGEKLAEVRREYVDGHVYAMAGTSDEHNRIVVNLGSELRAALRGKRCEPFTVDVKVKIPPAFADAFYYPDVMVVCDPTDNAKYFRECPTVIFEILSPDTERTDRREKAIAYRQISTIQNYILVEQDRLAMTVLHRAEDGRTRRPGRGAATGQHRCGIAAGRNLRANGGVDADCFRKMSAIAHPIRALTGSLAENRRRQKTGKRRREDAGRANLLPVKPTESDRRHT